MLESRGWQVKRQADAASASTKVGVSARSELAELRGLWGWNTRRGGSGIARCRTGIGTGVERAANVPAMIGILGGMGPAATVDFLGKLVAATQALCDQQHVPVVVYSVPQIPDRTLAILAGGESPLDAMQAGLDTLERAGATHIAIACNTAHHWFDSLARGRRARMLHIVDAALGQVPPERMRIALLATEGTYAAGVYARRIGGLMAPEESERRAVAQAIAAVKSGDVAAARGVLRSVAAALAARGAQAIIMGCTEIPVALSGLTRANGALLIDASAALAKACVASYRAGGG
jgi:aspartate racemase